jgi:hypothetical protein
MCPKPKRRPANKHFQEEDMSEHNAAQRVPRAVPLSREEYIALGGDPALIPVWDECEHGQSRLYCTLCQETASATGRIVSPETVDRLNRELDYYSFPTANEKVNAAIDDIHRLIRSVRHWQEVAESAGRSPDRAAQRSGGFARGRKWPWRKRR